MIRTGKLIPEIYYRESRDFQLFGKTYDIIFNYIKTNVDLMENFPISNYTDSKLIDLLCRTLGFENKENYRNDDLNAICNVFMSLIKNKGTIKSVETLVKTILRVEGIKRKFDVAVLTDENQKYKEEIHYNSYLSFDDFIKHSLNARCTFETLQKNGSSPTTRFSMCMLYKRKLLTNCTELLDSEWADAMATDNIQVYKNMNSIDFEWIKKNCEYDNQKYIELFSTDKMIETMDKAL